MDHIRPYVDVRPCSGCGQRAYKPNVVKAAWNIFGRSYLYRQKYNEYKKRRLNEEKEKAAEIEGQMSIYDFMKGGEMG